MGAGSVFEKRRMRLAIIPATVFISLLWLIFLVDNSGATGFDFFRLGIYPERLSGLLGIFFSPFIHSSAKHLASNTLPLVILLWSIFYFYNSIAWRSVFFLWLISGFITWLIGRDSYHIGASGLVFSFAFFLFFSGIFRKYIPLIAVSMIVAFIYGSMVWSIFPIAEYIDKNLSWEGHLSGTISGFIVAIIFRKKGPQKPPENWTDDDDNDDDNDDNDDNDDDDDDNEDLVDNNRNDVESDI